MSNAFVGGMELWRGDGGSPLAFARVCQAFEMSGIGETNALVESTTFCSSRDRGATEYIAGLADGSEVTFNLNYETVLPDAAVIDLMIADVKAKRTVNYEVRAYGDINNPATLMQTFHLTMVALSWTLNPSPSAKNSIAFTFKVSGGIDVTRP